MTPDFKDLFQLHITLWGRRHHVSLVLASHGSSTRYRRYSASGSLCSSCQIEAQMISSQRVRLNSPDPFTCSMRGSVFSEALGSSSSVSGAEVGFSSRVCWESGFYFGGDDVGEKKKKSCSRRGNNQSCAKTVKVRGTHTRQPG